MKLQALQRQMAAAVMTPLGAGDRSRRSLRPTAQRLIKPNPRLTALERLEIYNRQYWYRLLDCIAEDFPGLEAVLGSRRFLPMLEAYLTACPPNGFALRNLGARLPHWLRRHPRWTGARGGLAVEMARLEWAWIEAYDAAEHPRLCARDLAGPRPQRRLGLQPHLQLLALNYPVDELLEQVLDDAPPPAAVASNAVTAPVHARVRAVAKLRPARRYVAIYRNEDAVAMRRLEVGEFVLLKALREGATVAQALATALRRGRVPSADQPATVERWFRSAAEQGWFHAPARASRRRAATAAAETQRQGRAKR